MLDVLIADETDIVVGSRYVENDAVAGWSESRLRISHLATRLSRALVPPGLTDPMSGFFMMRRTVLERTHRRLSAIGFKLLLDLFASAPGTLRFQELSYTFRLRQAGVSKLDSAAAWDFGLLLLDKRIGRFLPTRFVAFLIVGLIGVLVHFVGLLAALRLASLSFPVGQAIATGVAMTFNYAVNNIVTYSDLRLRGWRWFKGWLSFVAACGIGAVANVGVASYLFRGHAAWVPAALAGILVGAVWNYVATSVFTWTNLRRV
jgi:dolichol-phosphate mannosyltransferase